jgi:hypothetical protein
MNTQANKHPRFAGIENATPEWLKAVIPAGWVGRYEAYTLEVEQVTERGPVRLKQSIPQWKFTSPDGSEELRIHRGDPRYTKKIFVARWATRYTGQKEYEEYRRCDESGNPIYIAGNPYNPQEKWVYRDSRGRVAPYRAQESHIPLRAAQEEQFIRQMNQIISQ